jgi:hypothetical protein
MADGGPQLSGALSFLTNPNQWALRHWACYMYKLHFLISWDVYQGIIDARHVHYWCEGHLLEMKGLKVGGTII